MPRYREQLPQRSHTFITDGGLETTLIFLQGINLPGFAAFTLLKDNIGYEVLRKYFATYASLARSYETGIILESATWRANRDWGAKLGYSESDLAQLNRQAIALLQEVRDEYETDKTPIVISGCIGPRGDGYRPTELMSEAEAEQYHATQIQTLVATEADMVAAFTLSYPEEAIGIARAAQVAQIPVAISFTVETDGRLPCGKSLQAAIEQVEQATNQAPSYYMINCAHPTHFERALKPDESWVKRIYGIRVNASRKSHAELDEAEELDAGNPLELGAAMRSLRDQLKTLTVLGGCCGTDHRHIEQICKACL